MKKLLLITLLAFLPVGASQKQNILAEDMRTMLSAMEAIQKGGFYNCTSCMEEGVMQLKKGLGSIKSIDAKSFLPEHEAYAYKFAQKQAKMIEMYANDLIDSLKRGDMQEAQNDYSLILQQCTSCHLRIRQQ